MLRDESSKFEPMAVFITPHGTISKVVSAISPKVLLESFSILVL
jgi:hypothetical protein